MLSASGETDARSKLVVIVGSGRVGLSAATSLSDEGHTVHLLDVSAEAFDLVPEGKIKDGRIVPIIGDGTLERDLRRATAHDADVFIAVARRDTTNAMSGQIAKHVFRVPSVICRINDPVRKEMYAQLGLITVSATRMVTDMVLDAFNA